MPTETNDRLDGWKQIADFLGVNVRSALRYESTGGLPVHRVPGGGKVYAYKEELQEWLARGEPSQGQNAGNAGPAAHTQGTVAGPGSIESTPDIRTMPVSDWKTMAVVGVLLLVLSGITYWCARLPSNPRILRSVRLTQTGLFKMALATDGQQLYYIESVANRTKLMRVPVSGGITAEIPTAPLEFEDLFDISPDGRRLLVSAMAQDGIGLWVVELPGGRAHRVRNEVLAAAWSPDQQSIVFASDRELFETDTDGAASRQLSNLPGRPNDLVFSPGGKFLRFTLQDGTFEDRAPWEVSPQGTDAHMLPILVSYPYGGRWTADGRHYVWITNQDGTAHLWARHEPNGFFRRAGEPVELSASSLINMRCVVPDKEGRKLFVIAGGIGSPRVVRVDPQTGRIAPIYSGMAYRDLDYSRDGQWVAYVDLQTSCLWRMKADGADPLQLTFPPMAAMIPHWSPDGRQIAFTAKVRDAPWAIYTVSSQGGPLRRLTSGETNAGSPTWSPDGKSIVFGDILCSGSGSCAIRMLDIASGRVFPIPGSQGLRTARWSPDGRYIAALDPIAQKIVLYEPSSGRWEVLIHEPVGDSLCWTPDSEYLYFDKPAGADASIVRINLHSRKPETTVRLADLTEIGGNSLGWFGLTPDGSILLVSDHRDWDIYALEWEAP